MLLLSSLFLISLFSFVDFVFAIGCPDVHPLLEFKSSADSADFLSSWSESTDPCSGSWVGVTCRNARVTRLVLQGMNLTGSIQALTRLDQLRLLSLQHNNLSTVSKAAALDLSGLKNMKLLYLSFNRFSGNFPSGISSLRRLRLLDLSHNRFSGYIPGEDLRQLPHLVTLLLEENSFTGPLINIPEALSEFNVSDNNLVGEIPESLSFFPVDSFLRNQNLCGKPLSVNCSKKSLRSDPLPLSLSGKEHRGPKLTRNLLLLIILADALALLMILALVFFCCYKWAKRAEDPPKKQWQLSSRTGGNRDRKRGGGEEEMVFFEGCEGFQRVEDLLRASAEMLGKGIVGTTYKAVMDGGKVVVVKRVRERRNRKEVWPSLRQVGRLRHDNVVALRAFYYSKEEMLLVYDFLRNSSLHSLLHGNRGPGRTPLGWTTRLLLSAGAAKGLAFLHYSCQTKMAHGHLTSSNILVDNNWNACISDFGLHLLLPPSSRSFSPSKAYKAPELVASSNNHHNNKVPQECDVYSFGVIILEILTGKTPGDGDVDLVKWVRGTVREEWTSEVFDLELLREREMEEEMVGLLQVALLCSAPEPKDRPKMGIVHKMIEEIGARGSSGRRGGGLSSPATYLSSSGSSPALSDDGAPNRNLF
ncbi:probable leucine-rich repeat receptor-like protein kinase At1g68400 [Aristolochia californica]|uniref:probable leucine-rich repeat receptor-like protein kinase At1g68400 n=1 Tax=Aristolochia californica TaxID=171875 RepID=UPI0035DC536B